MAAPIYSHNLDLENPPPRNLLEVKHAIQALERCPQKSDWISAINTMAKTDVLFGANRTGTEEPIDDVLARIEVNARRLTRRMHKRVGARLGYN